jgi:hypothetical protein
VNALSTPVSMMFERSGEENSGYAVANVSGDGSIHLRGFRQQVGYD